MLTEGLFALADDLSGAVETAACLRPLGRSATVELRGPHFAPLAHNAQTVVVADLDHRALPAAEAGRLAREALREQDGCPVFVKIDSLLRGPVAAVLAAAAERPLVVAPALPALGRTATGGVAHVRGVPLHLSKAWQAEDLAPPRSIAEALAPLPCRSIPLDTVRSDALATAIADSLAAQEVPICDGETDSDLDAVVAATPDGARLAGSGGLAAALGRTGTHPVSETPPPPTGNPLLMVVGTASPTAAEQLRLAALRGTRVLGHHDASGALAALDHGPVALRIGPSEPLAPERSRELARDLATTAARLVARHPDPVDLVLTGGETARLVLDALGVRSLTPVGQVHHGAVVCRTPEGTSVVTRPGSFGEADSLARIVEHLRPAGSERLSP
ncbi:four-carbon acid sugar kinase family protein [Saccharopolyspora flava]|uniref:4-hydroxythreonine-4-phosphate dehydrogenase n=1 Tax=Saccharopolyspora flava TaxID=95161 RepID=A0A1I6SDL7_9PSEU|nr:four-carbon acid sugar kinase family protein [Saccharopolyspora flava]SFS75024.1 4-hydroxythreonine-4-phosphate dehydrogenase [Saccharopolyspora flava]